MTDQTDAVLRGSIVQPERGVLTKTQIARLLRPVRADRVEQKQGKAYVPQHEVRAELIRIFGPGNVDHTMHKPELLYEYEQEGSGFDAQGNMKNPGKQYWITCYQVGCTLRVRDYQGRPVAEFTEYHTEENSPLPNRGEAHAMAVTSAQSYALRRAAISLGDALGLHLYNGGSVAPLVGGTLQLQGDPDAPYYTPPQPPQAPAGDANTAPATEETVEAPADLAGLPGQAEPHPAEKVPDLQAAFNKPSRSRRPAAKAAEA